MKRWLTISSTILLITIALSACLPAAPGENPPSVFNATPLEEFPAELGSGFPVADRVAEGNSGVGDPAPNFAFILADGRGADLASLRGKPVVLNFWATWCGAVPGRDSGPGRAARGQCRCGRAGGQRPRRACRNRRLCRRVRHDDAGRVGSGGRDWPRLRRAQHADDRFHQSRRHDRRPLAWLSRRRAVDRVSSRRLVHSEQPDAGNVVQQNTIANCAMASNMN